MDRKRDKRGIEGARRDEKALDGEREPGVERYLLIGPQESSI
jgi:Uma2 family endonuclease